MMPSLASPDAADTSMDQPPPLPNTPAAPPAAYTSLAARLLNVFAVPGEVFDEVTVARPSQANWLVPAVIGSVVGMVAAWIMFSQPAIVQKIREQQEQAMEQQVKAGKMTREQADQALAITEKFFGPTALKLFGAIGSVLGGFARVFWWATVLWVLGRWVLKVRFDYLKAAEVAGLASMIAVLGMIVTLLLTVNFGKLGATPSVALAVEDFDQQNKNHLLLGAVNVVTLWQLAVLSVGLARLAKVRFLRASLAVFIFWLILSTLLIAIGLGSMAL